MFGRRKGQVDPGAEAGDADATDTPAGPRATGPWDISEVTIEEGDESRIDLGCLLVTPRDGVEVQLQVDEATDQVVAVVAAGEGGAVELRAFAAPRHGNIWSEVRKGLAAEIAQMGGTATEREGRWGTELVVSVPIELPDGQRVQQDSTVVGIAGPRWLLRATLFGRPSIDFDDGGDVESVLRDVVVVRGGDPVPPRDPLPLTMPPSATRAEAEAE